MGWVLTLSIACSWGLPAWAQAPEAAKVKSSEAQTGGRSAKAAEEVSAKGSAAPTRVVAGSGTTLPKTPAGTSARPPPRPPRPPVSTNRQAAKPLGTAAAKSSAAKTPPTSGTKGPNLIQEVGAAIGQTIRAAFAKARKFLPTVLSLLEERAIARRREQQKDVQWVLSLLPLLALFVVPITLWRRGAYRRGRKEGAPTLRLVNRTVIATLCATALLFASAQMFLALESFKTLFAWATPAEALANNALTFVVEEGEALVGANQKAITPTLRKIVAGKLAPMHLLSNLLSNAMKVQNTWAFRFAHRLYKAAFPVLEHSWSLLLSIMLLLFLRYSLPGIVEIISRITDREAAKVSFAKALLRSLRVEVLATLTFILPYIIVTVLSIFVTFWVTDLGARGIVENLLRTLNILLTQEVSPALVVVNFVSVVAFLFEIVLLLVVVSAVVYTAWMQMLHDKFRSRRPFRAYGQFYKHFGRVLARLYPTVAALAVALYLVMDALSSLRSGLSPTLTLLLPLAMVIALNLGLWVLRFPRGLKLAIDARRWAPGAAEEK